MRSEAATEILWVCVGPYRFLRLGIGYNIEGRPEERPSCERHGRIPQRIHSVVNRVKIEATGPDLSKTTLGDSDRFTA